MSEHLEAVIASATIWEGDRAVVDAQPLLQLAAALGIEIKQYDEPAPVLVDLDGLPPALPLERVAFVGWLRAHWATAWCREQSPAIAGSPVQWDTSEIFPWVVEIHMRTPELDGDGDGSTALAVPCPVDPRIPSLEADAAICLAVARAMLHEGQESLMLDGSQALNPHVFGEVGLTRIARMLGAWLPSRS